MCACGARRACHGVRNRPRHRARAAGPIVGRWSGQTPPARSHGALNGSSGSTREAALDPSTGVQHAIPDHHIAAAAVGAIRSLWGSATTARARPRRPRAASMEARHRLDALDRGGLGESAEPRRRSAVEPESVRLFRFVFVLGAAAARARHNPDATREWSFLSFFLGAAACATRT